MSAGDLYALLGVEKTASTTEINKAYKRQALLKHPDRGGTTEEFQQLQKAHEVLENPALRAEYDRTGVIPGSEQPPSPPDLSELFGGMFGPGGGFPFFMGSGPGPGQRPRGPNKLHDIGVSLAELYHGKTFKLAVHRDVLCSECGGKGGKELRPCAGCRGQGVRFVHIQMGPMVAARQETCPSCHGKGQEVIVKCDGCNGKRVRETKSEITVVIEPGMKEGDTIMFTGLCSESPDTEQAGDLILVIRSSSKESSDWLRQGTELATQVQLSVAESLIGWERTLLGHPSGEELHVVCRQPVSEGQHLILAGKGMPVPGTKSFGSLHIVCRIAKPVALSEEQRHVLKGVWVDWKEPIERPNTIIVPPSSAHKEDSPSPPS